MAQAQVMPGVETASGLNNRPEVGSELELRPVPKHEYLPKYKSRRRSRILAFGGGLYWLSEFEALRKVGRALRKARKTTQNACEKGLQSCTSVPKPSPLSIDLLSSGSVGSEPISQPGVVSTPEEEILPLRRKATSISQIKDRVQNAQSGIRTYLEVGSASDRRRVCKDDSPIVSLPEHRYELGNTEISEGAANQILQSLQDHYVDEDQLSQRSQLSDAVNGGRDEAAAVPRPSNVPAFHIGMGRATFSDEDECHRKWSEHTAVASEHSDEWRGGPSQPLTNALKAGLERCFQFSSKEERQQYLRQRLVEVRQRTRNSVIGLKPEISKEDSQEEYNERLDKVLGAHQNVLVNTESALRAAEQVAHKLHQELTMQRAEYTAFFQRWTTYKLAKAEEDVVVQYLDRENRQ